MMDNYSLSDIRAAVDGNNGMGGFGSGDGLIWLVVLFLFGFGGRGGYGDAGATAATQHEILLGQQFEGVNNKLNSLGDGLCNGFYSLNNSVMGEGRAIQSQLAECCCNTQLAIKDVMAGIHAEGEATRAMFRENEIQSLRDKVTDLQLRSSQCDQNAYLVNALRPCPVPAYLTCSPYQSYGQCGCGFGCNSYQPNI